MSLHFSICQDCTQRSSCSLTNNKSQVYSCSEYTHSPLESSEEIKEEVRESIEVLSTVATEKLSLV
tara:strand:+ start:13888 stop:14085 length:198 start_codon:yes stop_codon:yes gene_type:complete